MRAHLTAGQRVLAAVPADPSGGAWALALGDALVVVGPQGVELSARWEEVERAKWDGQERTFELGWLDPARPVLRLEVPETLPVGQGAVEGREQDVDPNPFARVLRERVESVVVHRVSAELGSGQVVSVSVRRDGAGALRTVVSGVPQGGLEAADQELVAQLERRARDGVGLPTQ